jgi:asparagine synthase (glutamine-hydrolysing)
MGKKPLYWTDTGREILFGSELKALLQHPDCSRDIDPGALAKYLSYEYVPAPDSIFSGVHKLPAAHTLLWERGRTTVKRYWDLRFGDGGPRRSEAAYADELRNRLREAVRLRLVSDVPLGVFLSGGIDSSSVVAMMADLMPADRIKTFSIGFEDRSFDETSHARNVARFFGTDHREEILRPQTMVDILPNVAAFLDEPFADASIVPTYLLARFTRQHVTVALGGDGGDELLAGYPTFQAERVARWYRLPRSLHDHVVVPLAERLPVSTDNFSFDFKLKRFLLGAPHPPGMRNQVWLGAFGPAEQERLLAPQNGASADPYADIAAAEAECTSGDALERMIYLYSRFYLQDDILVKADRASMACSLEVRAPFLDYTFVEFLNGIPSDLKLHGFTTKYILKRAMESRLPPGIAARGKKGFGMPVAKWFKHELRDLAQDVLSERPHPPAGPVRVARSGPAPVRAFPRLARQPQTAVDVVHVPAVVRPVRGAAGEHRQRLGFRGGDDAGNDGRDSGVRQAEPGLRPLQEGRVRERRLLRTPRAGRRPGSRCAAVPVPERPLPPHRGRSRPRAPEPAVRGHGGAAPPAAAWRRAGHPGAAFQPRLHPRRSQTRLRRHIPVLLRSQLSGRLHGNAVGAGEDAACAGRRSRISRRPWCRRRCSGCPRAWERSSICSRICRR